MLPRVAPLVAPSMAPSIASSIALSIGLCIALSLGSAGCSRVHETEPSPVNSEMNGMGKTAQPTTPPSPPSPPASPCPKDPDPSQNASLYGKGVVVFGTPDGKDHSFSVEVAVSDAAQERGLMFRTTLADDRGMVFVFPAPQHSVFWMKNTCIALDMVFVSEDQKVIGVVTAPPLNEAPREVPGFSKYVVELAAGVAQKRGIAIGTTFSLRSP